MQPPNTISGADDVIAFAEDPVDLTERDRQCDREDAERDDIARSRTECRDETGR